MSFTTQLVPPSAGRSWVIIDLESAVVDDTAHKRYQAMERWVPEPGKKSRRGYKRSEDPNQTPRWVFQTVTTAVVMVLIEHQDGNVDIQRLETFSAPRHDEAAVISQLLKVLEDAPVGAELVTYGGRMHDVPILHMAAMRYGLTLPRGWEWIAFGGVGRTPHLDLGHITTGGSKMKQIHEAEVLAALNIPAKIVAPAWTVTKMIYAGAWDQVMEMCEGDVISTALMLVHWRKLFDPRTDVHVAKDRILRRVEALRPNRAYIPAFREYRGQLFAKQQAEAQAKIASLAPWLEAA